MPREIHLFEILAIFTPYVMPCDHYVTSSYRETSIYGLGLGLGSLTSIN